MSGDIQMPDPSSVPVQRARRPRTGLTASQWTILILMGGVLLAIGGTLLWVLREGLLGEPVDVLATVVSGPTPTPTPSDLVRDAVPTPSGLYWPAQSQPLAKPNAPGDLLWWDARFAYRCQIQFDEVSRGLPAGMWARLLYDGEGAQREGKVRADGADLRVVVWDGVRWWELPRNITPRREKRGWNVVFPLQSAEILEVGHYYLYYGHPYADMGPIAASALSSSRLLLSLGAEEGVEWGPEITWTAHSTATQTLVSPDGRIVIESSPGALNVDIRVRLRTVPVGEKNTYGPLPDFELHAEPPPSPLTGSKIVHWRPPLTVHINWVGLPVSPDDVQNWSYFVYDEDTGSWYAKTVDFDPERGIIRMVTDQL